MRAGAGPRRPPMFRTVRSLVASAVFSVTLFAISVTAYAMPAPDIHDQPAQAIHDQPLVTSPVHSAVSSASDNDATVWIVGGALVVALAAFAVAMTYRSLTLRPART